MVPIEAQVVAGKIDTYATEMAIEIAGDDAGHGCWLCSAPLNLETIDAECPGGSNG
jgi:Zn finger protein HypA/HybF involved in hydrogenase expression